MTTSLVVDGFIRDVQHLFLAKVLEKPVLEKRINELFTTFLENVQNIDNNGPLIKEAEDYKDQILNSLEYGIRDVQTALIIKV